MTDIRKLANLTLQSKKQSGDNRYHAGICIGAAEGLALFTLEALAVLGWYGTIKDHDLWPPDVLNDKGQSARELLEKWAK